MKNRFIKLPVFAALIGLTLAGCGDYGSPNSDKVQEQQQEKISEQSNSAVGIPAITNFTEKRLAKLILEKRDIANLNTYTYTYDQMTGKFRFMGNTIGFGLPYSTQFTNPERVIYGYNRDSIATLPQADPNGLFSPGNAEGTWILMQNPAKPSEVEPVYIESRITVTVFPLPASIVEK